MALYSKPPLISAYQNQGSDCAKLSRTSCKCIMYICFHVWVQEDDDDVQNISHIFDYPIVDIIAEYNVISLAISYIVHKPILQFT